MKVGITGASGFLGGMLAEAYHKRGDTVVALVRQSSDTSRLKQIGADLVVGELNDPDAFGQLVDDVDLAIHSAAMATDFGPWDQFLNINVDSVRLFLDACLNNKVPRAIYISSVVVYGNGKNHRGTDEDGAYESIIVDNYTRSKIMAERIATEFIQEQKLPLTIIRPGYIWGEGDRAIMPKLIDSIKRKRIGVVDGGQNIMNLSHVENVVQGVMLAAGNDQAIGRAYNITDGSKITTKRFLEDILDLIGVELKIRSFPYAPAYVVAYFCELYARISGYRKYPLLTRYTVRVGKYDQVFDISRAIYELGYKPKVRYKEGMAQMIGYMRRLYYGQK